MAGSVGSAADALRRPKVPAPDMLDRDQRHRPRGGNAARPTARRGLIFPQVRWYWEVLLVAGFYQTYGIIRNQFGSNSGGKDVALANALDIIALEKRLGLYVEPDIQAFFIDNIRFIQFWNVFYGSLHLFVTGSALIYLYRVHPADYARWRTAGLTTTGLALIGFSGYPLMPPRLLGSESKFGANLPDIPFVDTALEIGGFWSFDNSAIAEFSNQYAAMPSLHCGWALWCALVFVPRLQNRVLRVLLAIYPVATVFAVVVTANHYWLDAIGGYLIVAMGYGFARAMERLAHKRHGTTENTPSDQHLVADSGHTEPAVATGRHHTPADQQHDP